MFHGKHTKKNMARKLHNRKKQNKMKKIQKQIGKEIAKILNKHEEGLATDTEYETLEALIMTMKLLNLIKNNKKQTK